MDVGLREEVSGAVRAVRRVKARVVAAMMIKRCEED